VGNDRGAVPLIGIDHAKDNHAFGYFNLTFYAPIRLALEQELKMITFGNAAYQAKIRRGCLAEPSYVFWRPRGRAGRLLGRQLAASHQAQYRRKFRRELAANEFTLLADSR
jgi:hypothetical protein